MTGRKPRAALLLSFIFVFLVPGLLEAGESWNLALGNLYYDRDDYQRAYGFYQHVILGDGELSGDTLYRYGYSYEQIKGLDETALKIYALSRYHHGKEEQLNSKYALYAAAKLGSSPLLDDRAAAALLAELREGIDGERKAYLYRGVDRLYGLFSRFSFFQWKLIASALLLIPLLAGAGILWVKGRASRP
ncbi:MAG: hypothetical protein LBQ46_11070 [Treponema sp.]|jgi:hypothetical protein|nr:hypothetical protein [Treponema sp.]